LDRAREAFYSVLDEVSVADVAQRDSSPVGSGAFFQGIGLRPGLTADDA
jgi:hypothetical protein